MIYLRENQIVNNYVNKIQKFGVKADDINDIKELKDLYEELVLRDIIKTKETMWSGAIPMGTKPVPRGVV